MRTLRLALVLAPTVLFFCAQGCVPTKFGSPGFYCSTDPMVGQGCPPGQMCVGSECVNKVSSTSAVTPPPKTASYTGPMTDPGLVKESDCPDGQLEPNDTLATAVNLSSLALVPDGPSEGLTKLAICPKGKNPLANGGHDVDLYQLTVASSVSAVINIVYDVAEGDLDLGLYSAQGTLIMGDGSATSNGCVASAVSSGVYYIGVFGANNVDSNRYTMNIRYFSSAAMGCTAPMSNPDFSTPPIDFAF